MNNLFRSAARVVASFGFVVSLGLMGPTGSAWAQAPSVGGEVRALGKVEGQTLEIRPGKGARLVGMKVNGGPGTGHDRVFSCTPIFRADETPVADAPAAEGGAEIAAEARPGYAVGAIVGQGGDRVWGFRLVFMREKGVGLDPTDSYASRWLGQRSTQSEVLIEGGGKPIVALTTYVQRSLVGLKFVFAGDPGSEPIVVKPPTIAEAVERLEAIGVRLTFDETRAEHPVVKADFSGMQLNRNDLAPLVAFSELETLDLSSTFGAADLDCTPIASLKKLRELDLTEFSPTTPHVFQQVGKLTELRRLKLAIDRGVSDENLAALKGLVNLESLVVGGYLIHDRGMEHLTALPKLESVLLENTNLTDDGAKALAKVPQLKHLTIRGSVMTDAGLATLATIAQLESIEILNPTVPKPEWEPRITAAGLREFAKLPELKKLSVSGHEIKLDDAAIGFLVQMKNLEHLVLWSTPITDAGVRVIGTLRKLKTLSLEHCTQISDAGMAHLVRCTTLKELWLSFAPIGGEGLAHLTRLEGLERLHLNGTKTDDDALQYVAGMKELQQLTLVRTAVRGPGLKHLAGLTKLKLLEFAECKLESPPWEALAGLTELRALSLRKTLVFNADMAGLKHLPGLRRLFLGGTVIGDKGIATLAEFAELEALELGGTQVSDEALPAIAKLRSLKELNLAGTRVSDEGMKEVGKLKQLTMLILSGTRITDACAPSLAGCKKLIRLYLQDTRVTKQGAQQLQQLLPHAAVFIYHVSGPLERTQ